MKNIFSTIKSKLRLLYSRYDTKDVQFVSAVFSVLSTLAMTYLTVLMSIANSRMAEANDRMAEANDRMSYTENQAFVLARYQHTLDLCQKFRQVYDDVEAFDRHEFKIWEYNDPEYSVELKKSNPQYKDLEQIRHRWRIADSTNMDEVLESRIHYLMKNQYLQQMLLYFEEAKILHKKQLLDLDAFYNDFNGIVTRLKKTQYPSVGQYISHIRSASKRADRNLIWDGYYYCVDNIFPKDYHLPQNGTVTRIHKHVGDKIEPGDIMLSFKAIGNSREENLVSRDSGEINGLFATEGMICDTTAVILKISQKDYVAVSRK